MLFILFDIEIVFMYPWAVAFKTFVAQFGTVIFWSMSELYHHSSLRISLRDQERRLRLELINGYGLAS